MNTFLLQALSGNNSWISYFSVVLITIGFFFIGQIPISLLLYDNELSSELYTPQIQQIISYPIFFLLLNLQFILALAALILFTYLLQRRSPLTLLTSASTFRFNRLGWGMLVTLFVIIVSEIIYYILHPNDYTWQFEAQKFFPFLLVAILIFPIQTGFEEVFFRGYIFQGIAIGSRSIILGWIISSVLFGLAHSFNTEIAEYGMFKMLFIYIFYGLALGFVSIYTQGLEVAMGFHLINNLYIALVKIYQGSSLQTPALFKISNPNPNYMIGEAIIGMLIFIFLAIYPYKTKHWMQLFTYNTRHKIQ